MNIKTTFLGAILFLTTLLVWPQSVIPHDGYVDFVRSTNQTCNVWEASITNVITGDNHTGCETCEMIRQAMMSGGAVPAIYHPPHNAGPYRPATEKWTVTNVVSRAVFTIRWRGEKLRFSHDTIESSVTNRWAIKTTWEKK